MEKFYYYGRFKNQNKIRAQIPVPQTKRFVVRARVDEKLLRRIRESGIKEGELLRKSVVEYLDKIDAKSWAEEAKEIYG